jgi:hypothetical protein
MIYLGATRVKTPPYFSRVNQLDDFGLESLSKTLEEAMDLSQDRLILELEVKQLHCYVRRQYVKFRTQTLRLTSNAVMARIYRQ